MTLGIDVVSVSRLKGLIDRHPEAESRFFTDAERNYCADHTDPATHLAGTFAAKEAVVKALGLSSILSWARRIEIVRDRDGAPAARVDGTSDDVAISISHDAGVAVAVAFAAP